MPKKGIPTNPPKQKWGNCKIGPIRDSVINLYPKLIQSFLNLLH